MKKNGKNRQAPDLAALAKKIALVDRRVTKAVSERLKLAILVARCKIRNGNQPILRLDVEDQRIKQFIGLAKGMGINPNFAHSLYWLIINESCRIQISEKEKSQ